MEDCKYYVGLCERVFLFLIQYIDFFPARDS